MTENQMRTFYSIGAEREFERLSEAELDTLGTIYQTRGIMHYTDSNNAKTGTKTLLTLDGSSLRTTNTNEEDNVLDMEMTPLDIYRVNKLYGCNSKLQSK